MISVWIVLTIHFWTCRVREINIIEDKNKPGSIHKFNSAWNWSIKGAASFIFSWMVSLLKLSIWRHIYYIPSHNDRASPDIISSIQIEMGYTHSARELTYPNFAVKMLNSKSIMYAIGWSTMRLEDTIIVSLEKGEVP